MKQFFFLLTIFLFFSCSSKEEVKESLKNTDVVSSKKDRHQVFLINQFDTLPEKRGLYASHYPISNEMRIDLFMNYIKDIGGGYIGVGTDQNLSFIAKAKSEYVWLMDFDPVVVGVNKIHILFLELAETYPKFRELWEVKNKKTSFELVKKRFENDPNFKYIKTAWEIAAVPVGVPTRLRDLDFMSKNFGLVSFHNTPEEYTYLRELVLSKKIQAIPGDLTGTVSMKNISDSAKALNIPIRVVYTSNAEEYTKFPQGFRDNVIGLPTDSKSVLIRTITANAKTVFGYPKGEGVRFPTHPFHYNVHPIDNLKLWLALKTRINLFNMLVKRTEVEKGLTIQNAKPQDTGIKESGDINVLSK
jgi:hypothetical protein